MIEHIILTVPLFSDLCNLGFKLRRQVFVIEQAVPAEEEFDADDLLATHMVAVVAGDICGALRVIKKAEHARIGRIVVASALRGQGLGLALVKSAMQFEAPTCENRFYLSSQVNNVGFYERLGFRPFGEQYMDGGIVHISMKNY